MGPPLGHVRDPNKQVRFVEAELTALLQAAGGTLPVIKKNERGVYVMLESEAPGHAPAPAKAAKPAAAPKAAAPAAAAPKPAAPAAAKPAEHKTLGQNPNRQLFKRSTYVGVTDTGPVPGETFEQKVARLKALSDAAKQRAEEGGGETAPVAEAAAPAAEATPVATAPAPAAAPAPSTAASAEHKPTGNADRTLFKRSTYCGVVDTGPVPGESFEQKVERLAALSAAAKQRAEGG
jgi:pyruvate dehydrogenase E2 component (dihydrolipoamide acetyltransferase)